MNKSLVRSKSNKKTRQEKSAKCLNSFEKSGKIVARTNKKNNIVMTYYSSSSHLSTDKNNKKKTNKTKFEKENYPLKDSDTEHLIVAKFHNLKAGELKRK